MHSTNHISKSIYRTVIQLLQGFQSHLHTAISHVIIVLKLWSSHLLYAIRIHVHEAQAFKCINQLRSGNAQCVNGVQETLERLYCLPCLPILISPASPDTRLIP